MPFTPAHIAVVLPLMRGRAARHLVPGALAVGAMTPDLPLFIAGRTSFLPVSGAYGQTHSIHGLMTWDPVVGVLALALWWWLRAPLAELAPRWVRVRLPEPARVSLRDWVWAAPSVVVGAATHVLWDSFTHVDRWGVNHLAWLQDSSAGLQNYVWGQYASSVVGLAVVLTAAAVALAGRPVRPEVPEMLTDRQRLTVILGLAGGVAVVVLALSVPVVERLWAITVELAASVILTRGIGVFLVGVLLWGVIFHARARYQAARTAPPAV